MFHGVFHLFLSLLYYDRSNLHTSSHSFLLHPSPQISLCLSFSSQGLKLLLQLFLAHGCLIISWLACSSSYLCKSQKLIFSHFKWTLSVGRNGIFFLQKWLLNECEWSQPKGLEKYIVPVSYGTHSFINTSRASVGHQDLCQTLWVHNFQKVEIWEQGEWVVETPGVTESNWFFYYLFNHLEKNSTAWKDKALKLL